MKSRLDAALLAAQQDQAKANAFYDLFLNTVLIIPTMDDPGRSGPRRAAEGESFSPVVLENDGKHLLPAFDSEERLAGWAKREIPFVGIEAHDLLPALDPSLHIALNIGCEGFKIFVPDELNWLRERLAGAGPDPVQIAQGSRVLIGAPKAVPEGLIDALRECLSRNPEVLTAHLGQVFVVGQDAPHLTLALGLGQADEATRRSIERDIGVAILGKLGDRKSLDIMAIETGGIAADIASTVPAFYARRG